MLRLNHDEHRLSFDKPCEEMLAVCKALCCRKWDIALADEEYQLHTYEAEAFCSHDKKECLQQEKPCPYRGYRLKKNKDGTCIYLNAKNHCIIYNRRPLVCRNFLCNNGFSLKPVCGSHEDLPDDSELCAFEGSFPLTETYLFNPFLTLSQLTHTRGSLIITFKDLRSCKEKKVELLGLHSLNRIEDMNIFLKYFDGKTPLSSIQEKTSPLLSYDDFKNVTLYLIDEKVLIGCYV